MAARPPAKRRLDAAALEALGVDAEDWGALQSAYKAQDEAREQLIKRCRDMQKAAKQAVYSLVRGDTGRRVRGPARCCAGAAAHMRVAVPRASSALGCADAAPGAPRQGLLVPPDVWNAPARPPVQVRAAAVALPSGRRRAAAAAAEAPLAAHLRLLQRRHGGVRRG
jgi:hypothetical protein